jgi:hypothetical protein
VPLAPIPEFAADRTAFVPGVYLFGATLALSAAAMARLRFSKRTAVVLATALLGIFLSQSVPSSRSRQPFTQPTPTAKTG